MLFLLFLGEIGFAESKHGGAIELGVTADNTGLVGNSGLSGPANAPWSCTAMILTKSRWWATSR